MEATLQPRRNFALMAMLIFLAGLAFRMAQTAGGPVVITLPAQQPVATPIPTQPATFLRVEWMTSCNGAAAVGLYLGTDAACKPGQTMPLTWMQDQLTTRGLLVKGEYLEGGMTHPSNSACGAAILNGPGKPAGWLCADWRGVYRSDASGKDAGQRLQYWSNGSWIESQ
jgi:hypothetical protein